MVGATESVADSGEKAIRTFGALFLLLAGGSSLKSFIASMVSLDATVGRIAHNTGSTTTVISGLGRAAERVGGTFNGAVGGVRGFVDAFQQLRTTGQSGIMEPLARLQSLGGKPIELGKDWHKSLMQIADDLHALDKRDPALADYLGRQILGDEGLVNLAKQGSAAMREAERSAPKITQAQADAAQKLQAELAGVHQGFQDIGNSILMDFGPAMISGLKWVKDLVDANRGLIETKVKEWVKDVGQWFDTHKGDVEAFGTAVGQLATAAGGLATAFMSQSPMMQAMEAFAVLMGGRVFSAIGLVSGAMTALAALPAPAWLAAATGLSAVGTWQSAQRTAADMNDPKSADNPTIGVNPETGLTYHVDKLKDDAPQIDTGNGVMAWIKSLYGFGPRGDQADKVPDTPPTPAVQGEDSNALRRGEDASTRQGGIVASLKRLVGLGDDPRVREDIRETEKNTRELRDLVKNGASLTGAAPSPSGVTASSGGLGGSGRHSDGSTSPGAIIRDRSADHRTWYQRHAPNALGGKDAPRHTGGGGDAGPQSDAQAPGANGYGLIDAPYCASVEKKGERGILAPRELFDYLKTRGATDNEATMLTGAAGNESSFNPNAVHDGGHGHGLWGHNDARIDMRGKAWQQQADAALNEVKREYAGRTNAARTPQELADAEMHYERPRGYHSNNPRGGDNYTGRLHTIDRFSKIFGTLGQAKASSAPTAIAPVPAGTSAQAVSDAEVFAARQRIQNGGRDPKDRAMVDRYRAEQSAPKAAPSHPGDDRATRSRSSDAPAVLDPARQKLADAMRAPPTPTVGHALLHALKGMSDARKLTQHDGQPVSVEMTDRSATKLGERTFGAYVGWGKRHTDQLDQSRAILHRQAASYGRMMHTAEVSRYAPSTTHNVDHSVTSDTTVNGGIHVHTAATDARGIASDIEPHLRRGQAAARADYGLA